MTVTVREEAGVVDCRREWEGQLNVKVVRVGLLIASDDMDIDLARAGKQAPSMPAPTPAVVSLSPARRREVILNRRRDRARAESRRKNSTQDFFSSCTPIPTVDSRKCTHHDVL